MLEAHNPPVWLLEMGEFSDRYGYRDDDLVAFLREYAYLLARYRADENALRWDDACWKHQQNVLFIAEPHFARVVARLQEG